MQDGAMPHLHWFEPYFSWREKRLVIVFLRAIVRKNTSPVAGEMIFPDGFGFERL